MLSFTRNLDSRIVGFFLTYESIQAIYDIHGTRINCKNLRENVLMLEWFYSLATYCTFSQKLLSNLNLVRKRWDV
mgnify:CR=1 FL=1